MCTFVITSLISKYVAEKKTNYAKLVVLCGIRPIMHRCLNDVVPLSLAEVVVDDCSVVMTRSLRRRCWRMHSAVLCRIGNYWLGGRGLCVGFWLNVYVCSISSWHLVHIWCTFNVWCLCTVYFAGCQTPVHIPQSRLLLNSYDINGRTLP